MNSPEDDSINEPDINIDDSKNADKERKNSLNEPKEHRKEHQEEQTHQNTHNNQNTHNQRGMHHQTHHSNHIDHKKDEKQDDEINIDFSKIRNFFSADWTKKLLIVLLILIPVMLTIYVRVLPQEMSATTDWAKNSVTSYYRGLISQQVNAQYPNLPQQNKDDLINKQLAEFQKTNKAQIDQQVGQTAEFFKSGFQYQENNKTWTFLGDLDSYYWLRQAKNLEEKGMVCDAIIDGECRDTYMIAPIGAGSAPSMHPYGILYLYKILKIFDKNTTLMRASFLLPTVVAVIAAIAAFFIGRRLMNDVAGFFAAMFVSLSPLFITRTLGSDTDVWNVMFPLLIIWMFLEAFESKEIWKKAVFSGLAGLFTGLFTFAWSGWWYIFDFIIVALIGYIVIELLRVYIKNKHVTKLINNEIKNAAIVFITLIIFTGIFVTIFADFRGFIYGFEAPFELAGGLKVAAYETLWPNVLTTVAELNEASIPTIVGQVAFGINIFFTIALLGILFTIIKKNPSIKEYLLIGFSILLYLYLITDSAMRMNPVLYLTILIIPVGIALILYLREKETAIDIKPALIFTIWFIGMIYASQKGVRFILLLTPVFGIALGVALGYIYQLFSRIITKGLNITEKFSKIIVFILLLLILIKPIDIAIDSGKGYIPSMTKGWWDSLSKIRLESRPEAIINSWWDFGHWFKYVADRKVSLDGASQNHPTAHWLGKILQSNNENESVAILRMIDCGSNSAFDEINKKYNDTEVSQNIVSELLLKDETDARAELKKVGFTADEIDKIAGFMYCTPPEDYFITSEDMVGKAGVWAHFGLWDFDRAFIINNVRTKSYDEAMQIMEKRFKEKSSFFEYSEDAASSIYYDVQALSTDREMNDWIAPWPSYASSEMQTCSNVSNIVVCNINMGIGGNTQQSIVLEKAVINMSNPNSSYVGIVFYDRTTNRKIQEMVGSFKELVISNNGFKRYPSDNSTIGLSLLLDVQKDGNNTIYRSMVADSLLIDSTFTKLYYLDGRGMDKFEKFSDITDITGSRIIIWKVKW